MPSTTSSARSSRASAAALPRKMPAGSSALSRRASRAPSAVSSANERWTVRSRQKRTASHSRPGVARWRTPLSGSSANAKSTRTSRAKGSTWFVATRLRASMRRSLPATSRRVLSTARRPRARSPAPPGAAVRPSGRARVGTAVAATAGGGPDSKTRPPSTATARWARPAARSRSWDATTTVAPAAAAVRSSSSIRSRPSASRPAWGSSSSHSSGRRATSAARAVRRRWPAERRADRGAGEAAGQTEPGQRGVDLRRAGAHGATPEADVLRDGQVLVEAVVVAEQAHAGPDGAAVGGQVDAEDGGLAPADRQEPRAQLQERGLARAVRSLQEDDLAPRDLEAGARQGREAAEHHDGVAEVDHRFHRPRPTVLSGRAARQCRLARTTIAQRRGGAGTTR